LTAPCGEHLQARGNRPCATLRRTLGQWRAFADNLSRCGISAANRDPLKERVERGEHLVIVKTAPHPAADNGRRGARTVLGHDAPFPQGPVGARSTCLAGPDYLFLLLKGRRGRQTLSALREILYSRELASASDEPSLAPVRAPLEW